MRIAALFGVLVFCQWVATAQPTRRALSGPNFLMEVDSATLQTKRTEPLAFLPAQATGAGNSSLGSLPQTNPVFAMFSSALIPGSGQAANGKWGRAAAYLLVEAAGVWYYFDQNNTAKENERTYEAYANENWSPLAYAKWLVAYSRANDLNDGLAALNDLEAQVSGLSPDFEHTPNDWTKLDISLVRSVEVHTPFILETGTRKSEFSHVLQDYGSQQYYELMSKYYQFQPGWEDFYYSWQADGNAHVYMYPWNNSMITANFMEGRDRAEEFNDNYRRAGNILTLIMVNHIVSAFDAYFTVKLKNSRIETSTALLHEGALSVTWHF